MPTDYLDKVNDGWILPANADLQGTAWGWDDYQDDLGYRSKLVAFNEWTLDVVWNNGIYVLDCDIFSARRYNRE